MDEECLEVMCRPPSRDPANCWGKALEPLRDAEKPVLLKGGEEVISPSLHTTFRS
jgi:hypothetical protein